MREIKFRAWVIRSEAADNIKKMRYESNEVIFGWRADGVTMEIMQFTGLKDKNGKEIYEGDILSVIAPYDGDDNTKQISVEWHYDGGYVIEWSSGFFGGEADLTLLGWAKSEDYEFEVIGNMYENPTLLK